MARAPKWDRLDTRIDKIVSDPSPPPKGIVVKRYEIVGGEKVLVERFYPCDKDGKAEFTAGIGPIWITAV